MASVLLFSYNNFYSQRSCFAVDFAYINYIDFFLEICVYTRSSYMNWTHAIFEMS